MAQSERENLYISNERVVNLEIGENRHVDLTQRFLVQTSGDIQLEIKYPNLSKLDDESLTILNRKSSLKNIYLRVKAAGKGAAGYKKQSSARNSNTLSLCESMLGLYANVAYDALSNTNKIIVQGFVPRGPLAKQQVVTIGDLIVAIEDVEVNSANIESVLDSLKNNPDGVVKLTALAPITYLNLNNSVTNEHLLTTCASRLIKKEAPSKSTSVVKGDRVKYSSAQSRPAYESTFICAMILSLNHQDKFASRQNSNEKVKQRKISFFGFFTHSFGPFY
jgi:hypothetical protein